MEYADELNELARVYELTGPDGRPAKFWAEKFFTDYHEALRYYEARKSLAQQSGSTEKVYVHSPTQTDREGIWAVCVLK
ncbi:MAG TPA: hypothetical protein VFA54_02760 [Bryobacterales bacterium]|jgi:hypothetical protein|nr:hypothetical protein [Bryobacterales bacterium]